MKDTIATLFRAVAGTRTAPRAAVAAMLLAIACGLHGRATLAWVWDVYDRDQQRALRLAGEEPAGKAGRDAWAVADDLVLRKIAQAGLSGLSGMMSGTLPADTPPPAATPGKDGPAVASTEPALPASGAFRVSALSYTAR